MARVFGDEHCRNDRIVVQQRMRMRTDIVGITNNPDYGHKYPADTNTGAEALITSVFVAKILCSLILGPLRTRLPDSL